MQALRTIQAAGAVSLRFERGDSERGQDRPRVFLLLGDDHSATGEAARQVRRLLGLPPGARELEVVYGRIPRGRGQVAVLTRSVLQVLYELGGQIEVSAERRRPRRDPPDRAGRAADPGAAGRRAPADAYAAVAYRGRCVLDRSRATTPRRAPSPSLMCCRCWPRAARASRRRSSPSRRSSPAGSAPVGAVSTSSAVSTTKTASRRAGAVALAFSLTAVVVARHLGKALARLVDPAGPSLTWLRIAPSSTVASMKADFAWVWGGEPAPGPYSTSTPLRLLPGTLGSAWE